MTALSVFQPSTENEMNSYPETSPIASQFAGNGLCFCKGTKRCVTCRLCLAHNRTSGRKDLGKKIVDFLVLQPMYQHLLLEIIPTEFPGHIIYDDEKPIVSMMFEAITFETSYQGETPLTFFVNNAPLGKDYKRLYQSWITENRYGFFVVQKIIPGKEIHLTDLARKNSYKVYETKGTHTIKERVVVVGRIVPFLDGWMFYTETIVSFSTVKQDFMTRAAHVPIPQLDFIRSYHKRHNLGYLN